MPHAGAARDREKGAQAPILRRRAKEAAAAARRRKGGWARRALPHRATQTGGGRAGAAQGEPRPGQHPSDGGGAARGRERWLYPSGGRASPG